MRVCKFLFFLVLGLAGLGDAKKMYQDRILHDHYPTPYPTRVPTSEPTRSPTSSPSDQPTTRPTDKPTWEPTIQPTRLPTQFPTLMTNSPTQATPIAAPITIAPSSIPSLPPTTMRPTLSPTLNSATGQPPASSEMTVVNSREGDFSVPIIVGAVVGGVTLLTVAAMLFVGRKVRRGWNNESQSEEADLDDEEWAVLPPGGRAAEQSRSDDYSSHTPLSIGPPTTANGIISHRLKSPAPRPSQRPPVSSNPPLGLLPSTAGVFPESEILPDPNVPVSVAHPFDNTVPRSVEPMWSGGPRTERSWGGLTG